MRCFNCHSVIDSDAKFCPHCGKELLLICPKCGKANDPTSSFCKYCGTKLGEEKEEKPVVEKKPVVDEETRKRRREVANYVLSIISMSLIMLSFVLLFGLSFAPLMKDSFFPASDYTAIHYISSTLSQGTKKLVSEHQIVSLIHAFALLLWLITIAVLFIVFIAIYIPKFVKNIKERTHRDFSKGLIALLVVFISFVVYFTGFVVRQEGIQSAKISDSTNFAITIAIISVIFNLFVKEFILNKPSLFHIIVRCVSRILIFIFTFVIVFNLGGYRFHVLSTFKDAPGMVTNGDYGNLGIISYLADNIKRLFTTADLLIISLYVTCAITFILELLILGMCGELLSDIFSTNISGKQKHVSKIVVSSIALVLAIADVILNVINKNTINKFNNVEEYGIKMVGTLNNSIPILCIVMSSLILMTAIATLIVDNIKKEEAGQ